MLYYISLFIVINSNLVRLLIRIRKKIIRAAMHYIHD